MSVLPSSGTQLRVGVRAEADVRGQGAGPMRLLVPAVGLPVSALEQGAACTPLSERNVSENLSGFGL